MCVCMALFFRPSIFFCFFLSQLITEGQSLGYAFVNFVNQEDAEKAVNSLNSMRLQNKTIKVSYARPSSEQIKGANLYVCGLTKEFTQEELEKLFNQYGAIISSKILTDPKSGKNTPLVSLLFIFMVLLQYILILYF